MGESLIKVCAKLRRLACPPEILLPSALICKSEAIFEIKEHLNERGINYLLNIGPDGLGRIPAPTIKIFKKLGALLKEKEGK